MPLHHIIPKHEWKARFGDLEGFDALDNLVNLTTEQHSQAHALLYEMIGSKYDWIASQAIAGMIGKEEANIQATKFANIGNLRWLGRTHTSETKHKLSIAALGHKRHVGMKRSKETKDRIAEAGRKRKPSQETKEKQRMGMMGKRNARGKRSDEQRKAQSERMMGRTRGPYKKKGTTIA